MRNFYLCYCHSFNVLAHMHEEVFIPGVIRLLLVDRQMAHLVYIGTVKYIACRREVNPEAF